MNGNFRKMRNGSLAAPRRGRPPPAPEGYEPDPGNPFIYHPKLLPCKYRHKKEPKNRCCGASSYLYCSHFTKNVTRGVCYECPINQRDDAGI